MPVGRAVAIPAIRVSGVFLALATFGFGILVEQVFYTRDFMFGTPPLGIAAPRPTCRSAAGTSRTDKGFYYVLLLIAVLVVVAVIALIRTAGWAACSRRWPTRRSRWRPTGPPRRA